MTIVRCEDRQVLSPGPTQPTLQRLVERENGLESVTVLINQFTHGEAVPEHTHGIGCDALDVTVIGSSIDKRPQQVPLRLLRALDGARQRNMRACPRT